MTLKKSWFFLNLIRRLKHSNTLTKTFDGYSGIEMPKTPYNRCRQIEMVWCFLKKVKPFITFGTPPK